MPREAVISVIDDDPSVRRALGRLLMSAGFKVQIYCSSEDFLEKHLVEEPGCLILDVHLPGINGLELQAQMLSEERDCPILFITAFDDAAARRKALQNGAVAFLCKPLDTAHLLQLIETVMA